jgi:hypothetical protein
MPGDCNQPSQVFPSDWLPVSSFTVARQRGIYTRFLLIAAMRLPEPWVEKERNLRKQRLYASPTVEVNGHAIPASRDMPSAKSAGPVVKCQHDFPGSARHLGLSGLQEAPDTSRKSRGSEVPNLPTSVSRPRQHSDHVD